MVAQQHAGRRLDVNVRVNASGAVRRITQPMILACHSGRRHRQDNAFLTFRRRFVFVNSAKNDLLVTSVKSCAASDVTDLHPSAFFSFCHSERSEESTRSDLSLPVRLGYD
jgi:hypothetical protein